MQGLRELQAAFKRHLMSDDPAIGAHIAGGEGLSGEDRLAVYVNAYRARLTEALATDFRALNAVMGDAAFGELCHRYMDAHPSVYYSLRWFGRHLPAFLRETHSENLAELAQFEWELAAAFDADDAPVTQLTAVNAIPAEAWPTVRIDLHPSVRAIQLEWNTLARWRAADDEAPIPHAERLFQPMVCLVWRDGLITRFRSVDPDERTALNAVLAGATFAEVCERLAGSGIPDGTVALKAAGFMKSWLAGSMVSKLIL